MTVGFQINDLRKRLNDVGRVEQTFGLFHPILPFEHDIAINPRNIFDITWH